MAEKYASLNEILEGVYRNTDYASELDWGDAVSWAGESIGLIGAPALYHEKTTGNSLITPHVVVEDYRGELPVDFVEALPAGIRDAESKILYDSSSDSFRSSSAVNKQNPNHLTGRDVFVIKGNYIEIGKKEAVLEIAYRAFMIDDEGFPMIPDIERVKAAIKAYIIYKVDYKLWRKDKISERVYRDSEKEWLWYVGSAGNVLKNMSPDRREIWTRHWTRLMPIVTARDHSYAYIGNRESLNIGYKG